MRHFLAAGSRIEVNLAGSEIAVLDRLGNLLSTAGVNQDDPARVRLNPRIYPEDDEASREFDRLAAKERVEGRSADRELFSEGLRAAREGTTTIDKSQASAWARVLSEARVVLAARSGVFEEGWPEDPMEDPEVALSIFLGGLLEELVDQMMVTMEENQ